MCIFLQPPIVPGMAWHVRGRSVVADNAQAFEVILTIYQHQMPFSGECDDTSLVLGK